MSKLDDIKNNPGLYLQQDKRGKGYICPICGSGSGPNGTGIAPSGDDVHFTCWAGKCFTHKDVIDIIGLKYGIEDHKEKFRKAQELYNAILARPAARNIKSAQEQSKAGTDDYTGYYGDVCENLPASKDAIAYLQKRGISLEVAQLYGVGFDPEWKSPKAVAAGKNPPGSPRIIIPNGKQGYLARDIRDDSMLDDSRRNYTKLRSGKRGFFNLRALYGNVPVFVVEGEFDALSIIEAGGAAISLGSVTGADDFISLCKSANDIAPVILALDNDDRGRAAQAKIKQGLQDIGAVVSELDLCGSYKDPNERLVRERELFVVTVKGALGEGTQAAQEVYISTADASYLQTFFEVIRDRAITPAIPSGFSHLDKALDGGFYEGLYIVGALSSLGKTTFVLQAVNQMAEAGQDVLFFSLEMARYELIAKSISRWTYLLSEDNTRKSKTTRGILAGQRYSSYSQEEWRLMESSVKRYESYAHHIFTHEGVGTIGVDQIAAVVKKHVEMTGVRPVVVIDYLQILAPYDIRATDKQNTDKSVLELKRLSRDYKIPIVGISSFNRENYTSPVNMASFKESGAVEYSSDVLIGLQLEGMDDLDSDKKKAIQKIEDLKSANPRKAQLKILKNRNGRTGVSIYFDYFPMFNVFKERDKDAEEANVPERL